MEKSKHLEEQLLILQNEKEEFDDKVRKRLGHRIGTLDENLAAQLYIGMYGHIEAFKKITAELKHYGLDTVDFLELITFVEDEKYYVEEKLKLDTEEFIEKDDKNSP